jgi:hypothetical protein
MKQMSPGNFILQSSETKQAKFIYKIIVLLGLMWIPFAQAQQNEHGQHTSAMGIHGMALFVHNGSLYASHMPLLNSIHAHQVIFTVALDEQDAVLVQKLAKENPLLSLMPQPFDLMKLMDGTLTEFRADLYVGHFERSGELVKSAILVKVEDLALVADLSEGSNGNFFLLVSSAHAGLLVHKISSLPSFDQILEVQFDSQPLQSKNQFVKLTEGQILVPHQVNNSPLLPRFTEMHQLYLEQDDFR